MKKSDAMLAPATIISDYPFEGRFGRIPVVAQAAINMMLSKRASSLLIYYMSEQSGFAPSAKEIYLHTGLEQPNMSVARKELVERKFIDYNQKQNTITILWDNIMTAGKVAMMLADNPKCNVFDTLKGGHFAFEDK